MNKSIDYNKDNSCGAEELATAFYLLRENGLRADISVRRALLSLHPAACVRRSDARAALPAPSGSPTRQGLYTATPPYKYRHDAQGRLIRLHPDGSTTVVGKPKPLRRQARREACRVVGLVLVQSPILTDPGDFGDGDCALKPVPRRAQDAAATPLTPENCPELRYHQRQRAREADNA